MQVTRVLSSERIGGLVWIVFGGAVVYGAWMMDRLQSLGIPPATAPGVVPGLLGIAFMIFGAILVARLEPALLPETPEPATLADADAPADAEAAPIGGEEFDWRRVGLSWLLCVTYGGVLLGGGLPYWVLTAAFLFLHIMLLDETSRVPAQLTLRRVVLAAVIAPAVATVVMLTFQYVFLVRLP
jgi:hypothetical protein